MNKKIGPVLAKYFVEECEKNNKKPKLSAHKKLTDNDIALIEEMLLRIDREDIDLVRELNKFFEFEQD